MQQPPEEDPETDDEELNIASPRFNPLKALYSKKFKAPSENVKRFDNLSSLLSAIKQAGNALDADLEKISRHSKKKAKVVSESVDTEKFHVTAAGRKFLKEQAPIYRGPKAKYTRDIFARMENASGPIALLNKFKVNRTRVKIYVRKEHGIRGFITGFIEAFDKHLNIALVDCIEVWRRRKYKFSDNNVVLGCKPEDCSALLKSMRIKVPEISTKSIDRKKIECTRKIPQLMLRGEEVVLVAEDRSEREKRPDVKKA